MDSRTWDAEPFEVNELLPMGIANQSALTYRIDAQDVIIDVNHEFTLFALQNSGLNQSADLILGSSLWSHISDATTSGIYKLLVAKVRTTRRSLCLSFRCDAADRRRFMELTISPSEGGAVDFLSTLLREETRDAVDIFDHGGAASERLITMCSWCNRIATPEWMEVEAAVKYLRIFEGDTLPAVSHGICDECVRKLDAALRTNLAS